MDKLCDYKSVWEEFKCVQCFKQSGPLWLENETMLTHWLPATKQRL